MILNVQGLAFTYNSHPVLDGVEFTVAPGELVAILGPNGVGKTTLLKCINAIHRPSKGSVMVENADVLKLSPNRIARDIGYVAQRSETAQLTVFDAVLMGRKPHIRWRVSDKDLKIVDAALKRLHLSDLSLRLICHLSGGELQKVCVARAMVQDPRLLLLDEPTSSLDLKNQVEIMAMLKHVVESHGIAAVMTMHDLNTALRYADKVLMLKNGSIYASTAVADIQAEVIEAVYGLPVEVHMVNGNPLIVPLG